MDVHGALVIVSGHSRRTPSPQQAAALAGLPGDGVDTDHDVMRVGPGRRSWAFRGSWTRAEIEAARKRGVDVAVDVTYCQPDEYEPA